MIIVGTNIKLNMKLKKDGVALDLTGISDATLMILKPAILSAVEVSISIEEELTGTCYSLIDAITLDIVGDWKLWIEIPSINYISIAKNFKVYPVGTVG